MRQFIGRWFGRLWRSRRAATLPDGHVVAVVRPRVDAGGYAVERDVLGFASEAAAGVVSEAVYVPPSESTGSFPVRGVLCTGVVG